MSVAIAMERQAGPSDPVAALILSVAHQDRIAFRELYELTSRRIYGVLLRMLRRHELADDVLQEVFLAVWSKAKFFDPDRGAGLAWLTTVARYRAINRMRLVRRESRNLPDDPTAGISTVTSPIDQTMSWTVRNCLARLPDKQREAVLLTIHLGLTHEELAQRLDLPLGTAKSRVRRALLTLRTCVEGDCA